MCELFHYEVEWETQKILLPTVEKMKGSHYSFLALLMRVRTTYYVFLIFNDH